MIFQVKSNQTHFEVGDYVAFVTGEKSVNTYPKFLRIGKVLKVSGEIKCVDEVEELSTGKIWKPYNVDVIKVGNGISIQGVQPTLALTERL
jgi:hypothetical protein